MFRELVSIVKQTFKEWSEDKAARLAASLAYYTIFSIPPLLIIAIAIAGRVFGEEAARNEIVNQISGLVGENAAQIIQTMITNASQPAGSLIAIVVGIATLLLGASGVFGELQGSLNTIWEVQARPGAGLLDTIKRRFLSFTMVLGVGFLLLVSLVVSAALSALNAFFADVLPGGTLILAQILNLVVSFGSITFLFALIYKIIPDVKIAWRDIWIGAAVTAFLFTIGKLGIGLYLGRSAASSAYGAAGSLVILLLWIYYSAQILFLGAEFTQVYATRQGRQIIASKDAVPLTERARAQQGMPHQEAREEMIREADEAAVRAEGITPLATDKAQPGRRAPSHTVGRVVAAAALLIGLTRMARSPRG